MDMIRTVMGDLDSAEIGITLIHEHPFLDMADTWDEDHRINDFAGQLEEVRRFQVQGGDCIVDQTNIGMGRQPALLKRFAEATGLHIIGSTGFYREPWLPELVFHGTVDDLADVMIKEIEEGVEDGGYRAGLIGEIGSTEYGITAAEEKVLRAAAHAHFATGAAISTHTMGGAEALRQIAVLEEEGVDPRRVIISHLDVDHLEHLRMVGDKGVFIGFDTIGKRRFRDDEVRAQILCALVREGFEDQVVLSHDISRASYLRANGGHGYGHLLGNFLPRLQDQLSPAVVEKLLIHNARRALAFRQSKRHVLS